MFVYFFRVGMEKEWSVETTDGKLVKVSHDVMKMFGALELGDYDGNMIQLNLTESEINIIISFAQAHIPHYGHAKRPRNAEFADWETAFFAGLPDHSQIQQVMLKANEFDIGPLLELTCAYVAFLIRGKSPEELRQAFNKNV